MSKDDIRLYTGLVIRKGNEYLVGVQAGTGLLRWSISPWDAWSTRIRANARTIAERTESDIYLFNPIVGQVRRYTNG